MQTGIIFKDQGWNFRIQEIILGFFLYQLTVTAVHSPSLQLGLGINSAAVKPAFLFGLVFSVNA
jgi:hypothetical protein